MPYRYFLVPLVAICGAYLCYVFYNNLDPNAFILLGLVSTSVCLFVFQHQINNFWWSKFTLDLEEKEKNWVNNYLPYLNDLEADDKALFYKELAKFTQLQEYIMMGNSVAHEEIKWMSLGPAIRMKLYRYPEIYDHFTRTVFYPHPFISPQMEYIHVSETHQEDGMLIFSIDQLTKSHLDKEHYFNPALYEWSKIFADKFLVSNTIEENLIKEIIENQVHKCSYEQILNWMGQIDLDKNSLLVYIYCMNRSIVELKFPEIHKTILSKLNE